MYETDHFKVEKASYTAHDLVHKVFHNSNISDKLITDYDVLENIVLGRCSPLTRRLFMEGFIEESSDTLGQKTYQKTDAFRVVWEHRHNLWNNEPDLHSVDAGAILGDDIESDLPPVGKILSRQTMHTDAGEKSQTIRVCADNVANTTFLS